MPLLLVLYCDFNFFTVNINETIVS